MRVLVAGGRAHVGAVPAPSPRAAERRVEGLDLGLPAGFGIRPPHADAVPGVPMAGQTLRPQPVHCASPEAA